MPYILETGFLKGNVYFNLTKGLIEAIDQEDHNYVATRMQNPEFKDFISKPVFFYNQWFPEGPIFHAKKSVKMFKLLLKFGASPDASVLTKDGNHHTLLGSIIA